MRVVSALYECKYIPERGGGSYKSFPLLSKTISNIIFDEFTYVIYTNKETFDLYDKHGYFDPFKKDNVEIKFKELDDYKFKDKIEANRPGKSMYEREVGVDGYAVVINNKSNFLKESMSDDEEYYVWIDAGLLGTSCSAAWRDKMVELCHTKNFLTKINEKLQNNKVLLMVGEGWNINYEVKGDIFASCYELGYESTKDNIVAGGLFGGRKQELLEFLQKYDHLLEKMLDKGRAASEQDILLGLYNINPDLCHTYEFGAWTNLQKCLLQILDLYDESKYEMDSMYEL